MSKNLFLLILSFISVKTINAQKISDTTSIQWKQGYFDIHHILTGSGDCAFVIMPDGTTMIVDAGDIGDRKFKTSGFPLKSTEAYPNNSKTVASNSFIN